MRVDLGVRELSFPRSGVFGTDLPRLGDAKTVLVDHLDLLERETGGFRVTEEDEDPAELPV